MPGVIVTLFNLLGTPLTDGDRWPWLKAIADEIDRRAAAHRPFVVSCSALKRTYRDVLVHGRADVRVVYLRGSRELIAERLALRKGHFMPASLLDSQLATLEEPAPDESAWVYDVSQTPDAIVSDLLRRTA